MVKQGTTTPQAEVDTSTGEISPAATTVEDQKTALDRSFQEPRPMTDEQLRSLSSLDDIKGFLGDNVSNAADLGSGFAVLDKNGKRRLVDVPLLFLFWHFSEGVGDKGEKVSAHVVQFNQQSQIVGKWIINDGSTGIYEQLKEFTERTGEQQGLFAPRGLRASDYTFTNDNGQEQDATTFYIDTSPAA